MRIANPLKQRNAKRLVAGDTTFYQFDKVIGFWGIQNISHEIEYDVAPGKRIFASHNSDGNRDIEFELSTEAKSIICLGGSHTWGLAVDQTVRYSDLLRKRFGCGVVNMGHPSVGLDQIALTLFEKSSAYKPDIVIIEQYPWALHRILSRYVNGFIRPSFSIDAENKLNLDPVPFLARFRFFRKIMGAFYDFKKGFSEYRAGIDVEQNYDAILDPMFLTWKSSYYDYMYELADKLVAGIANHCSNHKIELVFVLGTVNQQFAGVAPSDLVDFNLPRARFLNILEANNVSYVDSHDTMLKENAPKDPVAFSDGHINEKGHAIMARILGDFIEKNGWLAK